MKNAPWLALGGALALAACGSQGTSGAPSTLPEADQAFIRDAIEGWALPMQQGPMSITDARIDGNTVLFRADAGPDVVLTPDAQRQCMFRQAMCAEPTMAAIVERAEELRFDYYDSEGGFAFGLGISDCEAIEEPPATALPTAEESAEASAANETAANEMEAQAPQCATVHTEPLGG